MKKLALIALIVAGALMAPGLSHAEEKMCIELYKPVCAAKQLQCFTTPCYAHYQTYSNSCFMANDNATYIHDGECTAAESGPVMPTKTHEPGEPYDCVGRSDGSKICKQVECQGQTAEGTCIAPKEKTILIPAPEKPHTAPVIHPTSTTTPHASTTASTTTASTTATTTDAFSGNWFARIWHSILHWLGL